MASEDEAVAAHWKKFGEWLEAQRAAARLTTTEAARRAGIHITTWSRLENGQTGTKRSTMPRVLEAVGITEDDERYACGYQTAGFVPPSGSSVPGAPTETRDLADDARDEYDRLYFAFEGEQGFGKLTPAERDALVRKAMEAGKRGTPDR